MTEHKATPDKWAQIEQFVKDCGYDSCLLEFRARVEALEATAKPAESNYPAEPDSSLVERLALTLAGPDDAAELWILDARAAIRVIADALRAQCFVHAADWLEQEAER